MYLNAADFVPLFREIKRVQETLNAYCLAPDKIPVGLDDIKYAICEEYGVKIIQRLIPLHSDMLRGMILIFQAKSIILIDSELSKSWTRYVATKEMCHHLVNNDVHRTTDPTVIIEYLVQDGVTPLTDPPPDIATEDLTRFAALELLFPFDLREPAKQRIESGSDTLYTTAEWLEIPEHLVEMALADWYMEFAKNVRAAL